MAKNKKLYPPFLFHVRWQLGLKNLVLSFHVTSNNDTDARKMTEGMLVEALKAMIEAGEISINDARPLYAEIESRGKPGDEEDW